MSRGKIAFRVDASLEMGSGHVMRCLTLANALKDKEIESFFICRDHPGNMIDAIGKQAFATFTLTKADQEKNEQRIPVGLAHASWLGCHWQTDATQTIKILHDQRPDYLVVDHYALEAGWEKQVAMPGMRIMVIDDLADRPHRCALLVDQNLGRKKADYADRVQADCSILTGPEFGLLRPEFAQMREASLKRRLAATPANILISMGGVDPANVTGGILDILSGCALLPKTQITVVLGPNAPWIAHVQEQAARMPWPVSVEVDVANMAYLMAQSDWAIGAGGGTSWERCALGLPTLMVVVADNQRALTKALDMHGAAFSLGGIETLAQNLPAAIEKVMDRDFLQAMSARAADISDGEGCARVVSIMEKGL